VDGGQQGVRVRDPSETVEAGSVMTKANFEAKIDVVVVGLHSGRERVSKGAVHDSGAAARPSLSPQVPNFVLIDVHDEVTRSSLSSSDRLDEAARAGRIKAPKASCGAHGGMDWPKV
jgi:hypothetical protein